ncbi:MAG: hypothetical protein IPH45_11255 [Bacteroidales bacterium]|nr:hypothetical protein [Bacteroidales bacterium]
MKKLYLLLTLLGMLVFAFRADAQESQGVINDGPQHPTLIMTGIFLERFLPLLHKLLMALSSLQKML